MRGHVDVAWAVLIACAAILYAHCSRRRRGHRVLAAMLACVWGIPLGAYLFFDRVLGKEEDGRYRALRAKWGSSANAEPLLVLPVPGLFVVFFSLPFAFIALDPDSSSASSHGSGSRSGRSATWGRSCPTDSSPSGARTPRTRGKPRAAASGLVRHPNYFFEFTNWCGKRSSRPQLRGLDRLGRAGRPPLPPLPRHGHPGDGGASALARAPTTPSTSGRRALSSRSRRAASARRGFAQRLGHCRRLCERGFEILDDLLRDHVRRREVVHVLERFVPSQTRSRLTLSRARSSS